MSVIVLTSKATILSRCVVNVPKCLLVHFQVFPCLLSFTIVAIVSYGNREYTPCVARGDTVGVDE